MLFPELKIDTGAILSPGSQYRYSLWRIWNKNLPLLGAVLLNPSTADAEKDDPTIQRMCYRARQLGYGGLMVVNLFALRSSDPQQIYHCDDPIGPENDVYIVQEMKRCGLVICGWGRDGNYRNRGIYVAELLRAEGIVPYALNVNGDGTPSHPLYLAYEIRPQVYNPEEALLS